MCRCILRTAFLLVFAPIRHVFYYFSLVFCLSSPIALLFYSLCLLVLYNFFYFFLLFFSYSSLWKGSLSFIAFFSSFFLSCTFLLCKPALADFLLDVMKDDVKDVFLLSDQIKEKLLIHKQVCFVIRFAFLVCEGWKKHFFLHCSVFSLFLFACRVFALRL